MEKTREIFVKTPEPLPVVERDLASGPLHISFYRSDAASAIPGDLRVVVAGVDARVANPGFETELLALVESVLLGDGFVRTLVPILDEAMDTEPAMADPEA